MYAARKSQDSPPDAFSALMAGQPAHSFTHQKQQHQHRPGGGGGDPGQHHQPAQAEGGPAGAGMAPAALGSREDVRSRAAAVGPTAPVDVSDMDPGEEESLEAIMAIGRR